MRFVEGPTQITLPRHTFDGSLQLVLIDGPHGYPFPDLEYYYFYPQLDAGALLIVDDIHIPTVTNLFDFLSVDDMFSLKEVVETTAFFTRTDAPTFSPIEDGWWLQPYNQRAFESSTPELLHRNTPDPVEVATPFFVDQFGPFENPAALARLEVSHGEGLLVTGWAIDAARRLPAAAVDLVLDGVAYRTPVRLARADVATAHANRAYLRSGFSARFPAGTLSRGRHDLEIRIVLVGEQHYYSGLRLHFVAT